MENSAKLFLGKPYLPLFGKYDVVYDAHTSRETFIKIAQVVSKQKDIFYVSLSFVCLLRIPPNVFHCE